MTLWILILSLSWLESRGLGINQGVLGSSPRGGAAKPGQLSGLYYFGSKRLILFVFFIPKLRYFLYWSHERCHEVF